jgi:hypothetical protein
METPTLSPSTSNRPTKYAPKDPRVAAARARVVAFKRCVKTGEREPDDPEVIDATCELAAANITAYVEKTLAAAPPLSDEQRAKLAELLKPVRA